MGDKSSVKTYFLGDTEGLDRAAAKARRQIDSVGRQTEKSGGRMKSAFGSMGLAAKAGVAGLVGGSMVVAGKQVFDMASNMQLMDAKSKTVFGGQLGVVQKWAKANANAMGLTSREAVGLSANFADLLIPMGFTREAAAKMSTNVVGLSGALSRWSGGTRSAAEVSEILAKAMLGEREGLKELGISISEADVQNRLLKNGKDKLTGAALEQAKAEATQQLIMEKSTDAQAAYAKGSTTLAARKAQLTAKIHELRDSAIAKLVPQLVKLGEWAGKVFSSFGRASDGTSRMSGVTKALSVHAANMARIVGPMLRQALDGARTAFDTVRASVERNRPQLESLYRAFVKVSEVVYKILGPVLKSGFKTMGTMLSTTLDNVGRVVNGFISFRNAVQAVIDKVKALISSIKSLPGGGIAGKVGGLVGKIPGFAAGTSSAPPGVAWVGENGPELVRFRGGEQVIPNHRLGAATGGNTYNYNITVHAGVGTDGQDVARRIQTELLRLKRNSGGQLGLA